MVMMVTLGPHNDDGDGVVMMMMTMLTNDKDAM